MRTKTKRWRTAVPAVLAAAGLAAACFAAAACSDVLPETAAEAAALGNGRIRISIAGEEQNLSRALTTGTAKKSINFYEVFFQTSSGIVRHGWYKGQSADLNLALADYDGGSTNKAILLAGTNNGGANTDFTLMAVGALTDTSDDLETWTNSVTIDAATKGVRFTLLGFNSAPSTDKSTTAFKITAPSSPDYRTDSLPAGDSIPTATIGGLTVPYFKLPKSNAACGAEYTIKELGTVSGLSTPNSFNTNGTSPGTYLHTPGGSAPTLSTVGVYSTNGDPALNIVSAGGELTSSNSGSMADGKIKIGIKTPNTDGLSLLSIEATVSGLNGTAPGSITWHIRPGFANYLPDTLSGFTGLTNTTNGGILLVTGDLQVPGGGLIITSTIP
jgi:hypothetical protein